MNIEDQVTALFAKANPVPSLDLLDPVDSVDVDSLRDRSDSLGDRSERGREVTERKTILASEAPPRRRPGLALAMATIAILVVAIPILINVAPLANPTPAEQVATAFMDAIKENDGLAIRGMYALEDQELKWNPDLWHEVTQLNGALGFEYTDVDCAERPPISYAGTEATRVVCSWTLQQDLTKALGLETTEGTHTVYLSGGEIVRVVEEWGDPSSMDEAFNEFQAWVQRSHPDDYSTMYANPTDTRITPILYGNDFAVVEPRSLALWDQYVDEFVVEHED